ncbi:MAG: PilZ domain-containing protein [Candidatus Omnitrophica bacterium]|nr:PilZ domain-containing protein [Candidatus Omnitrophota bacterium]
MYEDKRAHPRYLFCQPVGYNTYPEVTVNGSVAGNISLSGISLRVLGFVPIGTLLEMQISLGPHPEVVWVKGQVVRVREVLAVDCYEIGIKFVYDEEVIRSIGHYIKTNQLESTNQARS